MTKQELARLIGENIGKYRKVAGLTQAALAERIDVSPAYLAHVEQGNKIMSTLTLFHTAEALNVSLSALASTSESDNAQIQNIVSLLSDKPSEFQSSVERVVRVLEEEFGKISNT